MAKEQYSCELVLECLRLAVGACENEVGTASNPNVVVSRAAAYLKFVLDGVVKEP